MCIRCQSFTYLYIAEKKKLRHIYNKEKLLVITSDSKELKEKLGGSDIDEIYTNHYNFCHKTETNL
jgi:hypothetical protein